MHIEDTADLLAQRGAAYERYNAAAAVREEAEQALKKSSQQRASIIERRGSLQREVKTAETSAMETGVSGNGFSEACARLAALQHELATLDLTIRWFDVHAGADSTRAVLLARLEEAKAQHSAEVARLDCHRSEVLELTARVSDVSGGLTIEGYGPIHDQLVQLVEEARKGAVEAQRQLEAHDIATRDARHQFNQETKRP